MGPLADQLDFSKMTEQEIEFHYFKYVWKVKFTFSIIINKLHIALVRNTFANYRVHDVDNNTKLDGLEILHAIQHTFHEHRLAENDDYKEDMQDLPWIVGTFQRNQWLY